MRSLFLVAAAGGIFISGVSVRDAWEALTQTLYDTRQYNGARDCSCDHLAARVARCPDACWRGARRALRGASFPTLTVTIIRRASVRWHG